MSPKKTDEAVALAVVIALITLLHYATSNGKLELLHEISQRLYYIPIVYAAYRYGLKGSLFFAALSGIVHFVHISEHQFVSEATLVNQYAEVLMFAAVAIVAGYYAETEKQLRQNYEQTSAKLERANSELRETMELLVRAERLKSLGELSAAIAHEIRNPLGSIKGAVEILSPEIPASSPKREFVEVIEREADRLNRLVTDFLKYARPRPQEALPTDLNALVESTLRFISTQADKRRLELVNDLDPSVGMVVVDPEQIRQVLLNLLLNALQASPEGGRVEVRSRISGESVEVEVRDYGCGIPAEQRARVFDPFFTTRKDGSGLGLSIAYQIARQHGGELQLGQVTPGTAMILRLPLQRDVDGRDSSSR